MNFKFSKITVADFTKFSNVSFEFVSGINVFIGKNGTGKTHLLKLLFAIGMANNTLSNNKKKKSFSELISEKFKGIFKISEISQLIRNNLENSDFTINYEVNDDKKDFFVQYTRTANKIESAQDNPEEKSENKIENIVYLPTQEMLTAFHEFIPFYEKYDVKFDETLYYLAKSLNDPKLKVKTDFQNKMLKLIIEHLGGDLLKENNTFYINYSYGKIEATLLAEGIKKLATLYYLIENGTITENSILIWDEPEIYFNPKLILRNSDLFSNT
jgi:energy-coupling factor transporter ATP-binding protein EcfA2